MRLSYFMLVSVLSVASSLTAADFSNVINIPSPETPTFTGHSLPSDTQVNLFTNGSFQGGPTEVASASELNLLGGNAGDISVGRNTTINLSAGTIGRLFTLSDGSELNYSGGLIRELWATNDSIVNIYATEFFLNGEPFPEVMPNGQKVDFASKPFVYAERDSVLSGTFASGETFSWDLDQDHPDRDFRISSKARLSLVMVPEPTTASLALLCLLAISTRSRR